MEYKIYSKYNRRKYCLSETSSKPLSMVDRSVSINCIQIFCATFKSGIHFEKPVTACPFLPSLLAAVVHNMYHNNIYQIISWSHTVYLKRCNHLTDKKTNNLHNFNQLPPRMRTFRCDFAGNIVANWCG